MANIPAVYYIVADHGRLGRETIIDWEACTKRDIIDALIRGEPDKPIEVHCIDREFGMWADVSEEIALEVLDQLDHEPAGGLYDFLEDALGCRTLAEIGRETWGAHEQFGVGA